MKQYIKKIIPVTAVQWYPEVQHSAVQSEIQDFSLSNLDVSFPVVYFLKTIENQKLFLTPGCWIVGPGAKGEYWPVDDEVFKATYEEYHGQLLAETNS